VALAELIAVSQGAYMQGEHRELGRDAMRTHFGRRPVQAMPRIVSLAAAAGNPTTAASSNDGLYSSQHLESQEQPGRSPLFFNQPVKPFKISSTGL
jgi:hypothetical protein